MIRRYRKRGLWHGLKVFLFVLIFLLIIVILYVYTIVTPLVLKVTNQTVSTVFMQAINDSVLETLNEDGVTYSDFVDVSTDTEGNITSIELKTYTLNLFVAEITKFSQEKINSLCMLGTDVPLGAFTGISFLSDSGPQIKIKMLPLGSVSTQVNSYFESVGINQTSHTVLLSISASITIILPLYAHNMLISSDVIIAESIIVGKVPSIYLSGINLTP